VTAGTTARYTITVTDGDPTSCAPQTFFLSLSDDTVRSATADPLRVTTPGATTLSLAAGASGTFEVTATGSEDSEPGLHTLPFSVVSMGSAPTAFAALTYDLAPLSGCFVTSKNELVIRDTGVVDDPVRTREAGGPSGGAWTFGRLMRDLARTADDAPALVEALFETWLTDQRVNGFTALARPAMKTLVLDPWPRTASGALDLDRGPLRLLAIVNRIDLRDLSSGSAGEGRFVFGVLGPGGVTQQFTLILEYALAATTAADVLAWAKAWHDLGALPFPSEAYDGALEALTERFTARGAAPGRPNGSALLRLRTNDFALDARWEMRELTLSGATGRFVPEPLARTPDLSLNGTATLAAFANGDQAAIVSDRYDVPATYAGAPFATGAVFNDSVAWSAPGIANPEARFHLSLNTCNGCHGAAETNTPFVHIAPRGAGETAALSPFLMGTTVADPVSGASRPMDDLARRRADLRALVCTASPDAAHVARGLRRTH
jgi:hypothetical protein